MSKQNRASLKGLLILVFALLYGNVALADNRDVAAAGSALSRIEWNVPSLNVTAPAGCETVRTVAFKSTADVQLLDATSVFLYGSMPRDIVTLEPSHFSNVVAYQTYELRLIFHPEAVDIGKTLKGAVGLKRPEDSEHIPQALRAILQVADDVDTTQPCEEAEPISEGVISLEGAAATGFNSTEAIIGFVLENANFSSDARDIVVFRTGRPIPSEYVVVTENKISIAEPILEEGRNDLDLVALDQSGAVIEYSTTLWAGSATTSGRVVDINGMPVPGATVRVGLGDDQDVGVDLTADSNGNFIAVDVPRRTLLIDAGSENPMSAGSAAVTGGNFAAVRVYEVAAASDVDNNDFSQGLSGWDTGAAPASIVGHQEDAPSLQSAAHLPQASTRDRAARHASLSKSVFPAVSNGAEASSNNDLLLATSGQGQQTVLRTFKARAGAKTVKVRYRFYTTEVPGGYFGTQFNDYFAVTITSLNAGSIVSETQSMNGLGLAAFTLGGYTDWREKTLEIDEDGDTIQVQLTVSNVADGLLDSFLIVDFIEEPVLKISQAKLQDIDSSSLSYLSTDTHAYFGGNTRIHGTITVNGAEDDELTELKLEVVQGGGVVAVADLAADARAQLLQAFGPGGEVSQAQSALLFELPAAEAGGVVSIADGTVLLRIRARSAAGEEVVKEMGSVTLLAKYDGENRYGGRDEARGGDDWLQPSMQTLIESFQGLTWGDFSNMNAGSFRPDHSSHTTGKDGDGWFLGYNARDAAVAQVIMDHLNSPAGQDIQMVFVTYSRTPNDSFWNAIQNVALNDGRYARQVILPVAGHTTHFHWRRP